MSDQLICRIGTSLPAHLMLHYDPRIRQKVPVTWTKQPFAQIREPLRQLAAIAGLHDYLIPEYTPISNQGQAGTCVANGCSDALEMLQGIEDGPTRVQQLSRLWLYYVARQYTGDTGTDSGTFIASALHQLQTTGTFEEQYFPYTDNADYITGSHSKPELDCYTMASNNRIDGFFQLDTTSPSFLTDVETAIRANHPVVYAMQVGAELQGYKTGQVLGPATNPEGGHCQILMGLSYDGAVRRWVDRNSWSANWGDHGHALLSDACVLSATEAWVITKGLQTVR